MNMPMIVPVKHLQREWRRVAFLKRLNECLADAFRHRPKYCGNKQ